jgi:hypothetical protein
MCAPDQRTAHLAHRSLFLRESIDENIIERAQELKLPMKHLLQLKKRLKNVWKEFHQLAIQEGAWI